MLKEAAYKAATLITHKNTGDLKKAIKWGAYMGSRYDGIFR
ncbi:MAG: hypothetical protein JWQ09_1720 [Segetibacter sp.]|nr:hypothetical protein [Segetibacter sp.]